MQMIKRIFFVLLALVALLAAAVAVNTLRQGSRQLEVAPAPPLALDLRAVADTLAGAIRCRTISSLEDPQQNAQEFEQLHAWLQLRFPLVHQHLKREAVNGLSLLYTWQGADASAKPIVLMAHQDVVPISPGTEDKWQQPPFEGVQRDGFVWGRGAWDDKANLVAQLQAVETLLAAGFQPRQTVYLAFGADEEVGGSRGAVQIAKLLQQRKVHLDFAIDEGLLITEGMLPGLAQPVALIGIAEKGYLSAVLKEAQAPGHAAMPPAPGTGTIARMSAALLRLDREQMPARLQGVAREMFETIAPELHGLQRVALSNLWLFAPLVQAQLEKAPATNAMVRTTTALTIVQAGNKENVLPGQAEATVNYRMLPGDTSQAVLQHVRDTVGPGFQVGTMAEITEASPVSSTRSASYQAINRTLRSLFPGTLVAPGLVVGGTDSHHYASIADNVYRFSPVRARPEDLARFHGTNERIAVANLGELVQFYARLLRNLNAPAP